jgi:hypothetical protein
MACQGHRLTEAKDKEIDMRDDSILTAATTLLPTVA